MNDTAKHVPYIPDARLRIALDTNLLAYETPRRIFSGAIDDCGGKIIILPTVAKSATRRLRAEEGAFWDAKLANGEIGPDEANRITEACQDAVVTWFNEEIMRNDTPWEAPEHDLHHRQSAARIGRNLPPRSIKTGRRGEDEDRTIIGEAIVEKVSLISTHNLESIEHEVINAWLVKATKARRSALLASPDECVKALTEHHGLDLYETTLRHTVRALPTERAHWRAQYEKGLRRYHGSGLSWTANKALWSLEWETAFEKRFAHAMRASATTRAQEERRLSARRSAAQDKGIEIG